MVKVKICGITNLEDAKNSINAGCDALGFIFYKNSPRYITQEKAEKIIKKLPQDIIKIGVFVNAREKTIRRVSKSCRLDMLQFHGDESPEFCRRFKGKKIIKAFRVKAKMDFRKVLKYKTSAYLFDAFVKSKIGGTGRIFDWNILRNQGMIKKPIFLSGGLHNKNVQKAIEIARPEWLDVSSWVEMSPGRKDRQKVKKFIRAVKSSILTLFFVFFIALFSFAQEKGLLIDDFENPIVGGQEGTVDFGAGNGSEIEVVAAGEIKYSGNQSLGIIYNAVSEGYMWVARGFGLDAKNAQWLVKPESIDWQKFNAIAFYMNGSGTGTKIAFDIKDNGNEMWRFMLEDNFQGWQKITCPFNEFFVRSDWQPNNADNNATLDFPIKSFQFEPRPEAKGVVYFDDVELISK